MFTVENKDELLELLMDAIPYPNQMKDPDTTSEEGAIRFTWRGDRYRVSTSLDCKMVDECFLVGNDASILMRGLLQMALSIEMLQGGY